MARASKPVDYQRNAGVVADLDLPDEPGLHWKYAPAGSRFSDLVAFDGVVIALDRAGSIHALESATGKLLWKESSGFEFSYGYGLALTRRPDFDVVLVGCDTGVFAIERKSGKTVWHTELPNGVAGPTCTDASVFVGCSDGNVYALELKTGKVQWKHDYVADRPEDRRGRDARFPGKEARPGQAVTDGMSVYLSIFDQCRAIALDAQTGRRRWSFLTGGWIYGRPSVGRREVYVGSQDKHFYALDRTTGKLVWQVRARARNEAAGAVSDRRILFGSCDGNLYAVDRLLGSVAWKFATDKGARGGTPIYAQPLVCRDTVYLPTMSGKVYALSLADGELQWKFEPLADSELNCDAQVDAGRMFLTTRRMGEKGESAVLAIGRKKASDDK